MRSDIWADAVCALLSRRPVDAGLWSQLTARARRLAWSYSAAATAQQAADVLESLARAVASGVTFASWLSSVSTGIPHAEVVWHNALATAYSHGQWQGFQDVKSMRPYVIFDATRDSRTTELCRECDGTVVPLDSAWARTHVPPLHHRCRSTLTSLTESEAKALGITDQSRLPALPVEQGWGREPVAPLPDWEPDLSRWPLEVQDTYATRYGLPSQRPLPLLLVPRISTAEAQREVRIAAREEQGRVLGRYLVRLLCDRASAAAGREISGAELIVDTEDCRRIADELSGRRPGYRALRAALERQALQLLSRVEDASLRGLLARMLADEILVGWGEVAVHRLGRDGQWLGALARRPKLVKMLLSRGLRPEEVVPWLRWSAHRVLMGEEWQVLVESIDAE